MRVRATEALEPARQPALPVEDLIETFGQGYADVKTPLVAPGSPWENGSVESFNEELRAESLHRELFVHIPELRYAVDRWRMDYNPYRPHRSRGCMGPAAFAARCVVRHPLMGAVT